MVEEQLERIAADEAAELQQLIGGGHLHGGPGPKIPNHVSLLVYQPVNTLFAAGGLGRLVDVAPRPAQAPVGLVGQPASAGRTGDFIGNPTAAQSQIPCCEAIKKSDVGSYRSKSPEPLRKAQVQLEKLRYDGVRRWTAEDAPPQGAYIHQIVLAPFMWDLTRWRLPALGVAYVLDSDCRPQECRSQFARERLLRVAQVAGEATLRDRVRRLLGDEPLATLCLARSDAGVSDALYRLTAKFLFTHHWFYPYDPAAFHLLAKLADASSVERLYRQFGWAPPFFRPANKQNPHELLPALADDLVVLAHYADSGARKLPLHQEAPQYAEKLIRTTVHLLTGTAYELTAKHPGSRKYYLLPTTKLREKAKVVVANTALCCGDGLYLPVFSYERQTFASYVPRVAKADETDDQRKKRVRGETARQRSIQDLGPGQEPRGSERLYTSPKHIATVVERDGSDTVTVLEKWPAENDSAANLKFRRFALLRTVDALPLIKEEADGTHYA